MIESIKDKKIELHILKETLEENEFYCPTCSGIGRVLKDGKWLEQCPDCYNGVRRTCSRCGKELKRGYSWCDDSACREIRESETEAKLFEKAIKIKPDDEIAKNMKMFYSRYYSHCNEGYFSDWDEFFDYWYDNHTDDDQKPKYVWGTSVTSLVIDTDSVLSNACEELWEGAYDSLSGIKDLEDFHKSWCDKQSGTETYWEDHKYAIEIPWEEYGI